MANKGISWCPEALIRKVNFPPQGRTTSTVEYTNGFTGSPINRTLLTSNVSSSLWRCLCFRLSAAPRATLLGVPAGREAETLVGINTGAISAESSTRSGLNLYRYPPHVAPFRAAQILGSTR
jgi:hypothetical protein